MMIMKTVYLPMVLDARLMMAKSIAHSFNGTSLR